jgi:hypothetical protein
MNTGSRLRPAILFLLLGLLAATLGGCSDAAAVKAADATENFFTAQQYRQQALYASQHGDNAEAVRYLQMAQMMEPLGVRPALPPSSTLLLPQHRAIAPASGPVTCHPIGINRFSCF